MSAYGFADGQEITGWLGVPLVQQTGLAIGAGTQDFGPFAVTNFASVIVAMKPTGGQVTATLKQTIGGGPASLELDETFVVPAGATAFEAIVLFADTVTLEVTGGGVGTTVDFAVYPSNTTTNAQVITAATINVQHNGVLIAAEPTLDFVDALGFTWTIADDAPNTRVKVTPATPGLVPIASATLLAPAATIDITGIPAGYSSLEAIVLLRDASAAGAGGLVNGLIQYNGDAAANYDHQELLAAAAVAAAGEAFGVNGNPIQYPSTGAAANLFSVHELTISAYADATLEKVMEQHARTKVGVASGNLRVRELLQAWRSTAAINRITLIAAGTFATGSRVILSAKP